MDLDGPGITGPHGQHEPLPLCGGRRLATDRLASLLGVAEAVAEELSDEAAVALAERISALSTKVAELEVRAAIDGLTGVLRRDAGQATLEMEISRVRRTARPQLAVAFVDIDGLKAINDEQGHGSGDARIRAVAHTLRSQLRRYDTVARWGGDEFVCVLPGTTAALAEAILGEVQRHLACTDSGTVSVGCAELNGGDTAETLLARADQALYAGRTQQRCVQGSNALR